MSVTLNALFCLITRLSGGFHWWAPLGPVPALTQVIVINEVTAFHFNGAIAMKLWFHMILIMLCEALSVRRDAHIQFLKIQIEIYESKLKGNRVIPDPAERLRLLEAGAAVGHDVKDSLMIVELKTYKRWLLELKRGIKPKKVGRPPLAQELIDLVVRFAKENTGWGIDRIWGELRKVGAFLGRSSIKRVLKHEGLFPNPDRKNWRLPDTPWRHFLELHMNSIVACDFLSKEILTPLGKKTAYLLMFIHLEGRKVFLSPATYAPPTSGL
jgi:putative transposase